MRMRRAQAALEFLMTYSWAILVVIIIIGALAYFGVLNPQNLMPDKCTLTAGFSCDDYLLDGANNKVILTFTNGLGRNVNVTSATFTLPSGSTCAANPLVGGGTGSFAVIVPSGDRLTIEATGCTELSGLSGSKARVKVEMKWKYADMGADAPEHTTSGEIFARVEG